MRLITKIFIFLTAASFSFAGGFKQGSNNQNTIAQRLEGTWEYDAETSALFGRTKQPHLKKVRFIVDPDMIIYFPYEDENLKEDYLVYLAGKLDIYDEEEELLEKPFVLSLIDGMPQVFYIEDFEKKVFDPDTFQVNIFQGKELHLDKIGFYNDHYKSHTAVVVFKRVIE